MALNINGTTGISGVDGSASAPALQGTDSNTGVSFGTDTVDITTGGTIRARVDSAGKMIVGAQSGTGKFIVQDSSLPKIQSNYQGTAHFESSVGGSGGGFAITSGHFLTFNHQPYANRGTDTNLTERMRILSDGRITTSGLDGNTDITTTGTGDTYDGTIFGGVQQALRVTRTSAPTVFLNRNGSAGTIIEFRYGGSIVGSISTNANSLTSDKNYKKNITNLTLGLDLVNKLQPVSYHYKFDGDSDPVMYGLVAQDVETALNDAGVAQNTAAILKYEAKNDERESDYNLDYTKLTPILINAVKELSAKITTLETKVAALEAG